MKRLRIIVMAIILAGIASFTSGYLAGIIVGLSIVIFSEHAVKIAKTQSGERKKQEEDKMATVDDKINVDARYYGRDMKMEFTPLDEEVKIVLNTADFGVSIFVDYDNWDELVKKISLARKMKRVGLEEPKREE